MLWILKHCFCKENERSIFAILSMVYESMGYKERSIWIQEWMYGFQLILIHAFGSHGLTLRAYVSQLVLRINFQLGCISQDE